jgi:hypothetical protein
MVRQAMFYASRAAVLKTGLEKEMALSYDRLERLLASMSNR